MTQVHNDRVIDTEVLSSSFVDENILRILLLKAGRKLMQPALEAYEMLIDPDTPPKAKITLLGAFAYLFMPYDLVPDLIPIAGFYDDLIALTTVISILKKFRTPQIVNRAKIRILNWFPN